MTRTISFDLDGTLVRGPFGAVLRDVLPALGGGPDAYSRIIRRHEELLLQHPFDAYDWPGIVASVSGAEPGEVWRMLKAGLRGRTVRVLHDDTAAVLDGFRAAGWRVVVLTNGRRRFQLPVIESAGLPIDELVCSDDVGAAKPDPAMFAAARAGSAQHVHVGDRIDHDIAGSRSAGATGVLLRDDAPSTSWTEDLGAEDRDPLDRYARALAAVEGTIDPDASASRPDGTARSLVDLRMLLGRVGEESVPVRTA